MRVLVAFDKFKDALSAEHACAVAAEALRSIHPEWQVDECPFSDGGEGFTSILTTAAGGEMVPVNVTGPRGHPVAAPLGLVHTDTLSPALLARLSLPATSLERARIGIIDMASASGIGLLAATERDPWLTSSVGTGQLIREAQQQGCVAILLGVGGSATNDLGLGALAALGLELLTETGAGVSVPMPSQWPRIASLRGKMPSALPVLRIACDVTNPLLGPNGCAATFGPQKGLRRADLARMETESARMAGLLCAHFGRPFTLVDAAGSGAAGGIAFGLRVATGALLLPGAELVAEWLALERRISLADIVLTGEGRFDSGSLRGKGPGAIVAEAGRLQRQAHVFAGAISSGNHSGARLHPITPPELALADALPRTAELLRMAVIRELAGERC